MNVLVIVARKKAATATAIAEPDPPKMLAPAMTTAVTDVKTNSCPELASPVVVVA